MSKASQVTEEFKYYSGQRQRYRLWDTGRMVYEKINGLRRPNINLSVLYSQLEEEETAIGFLVPDMKESIQVAYRDILKRVRSVDEVFKLVRDQIFLDALEWTGFCGQLEGCPQCKPEQISYGPDFSYPFIRHLTDKEVGKRKLLTEPFANKLTHMVRLAPQITPEKPKILAIIDN